MHRKPMYRKWEPNRGSGWGEGMGHVAALVRSDMNGLKPFERKIEQTTETMPP